MASVGPRVGRRLLGAQSMYQMYQSMLVGGKHRIPCATRRACTGVQDDFGIEATLGIALAAKQSDSDDAKSTMRRGDFMILVCCAIRAGASSPRLCQAPTHSTHCFSMMVVAIIIPPDP